MNLKFLEVFESWQGEGVSQGKRAIFYRVSGCNLRCSWCDTKYAWISDMQESFRFPDDGIMLAVITGGEPLWDRNREVTEAVIGELDRWLVGRDIVRFEVEIETNGTQRKLSKEILDGLCKVSKVRYVVSPKMGKMIDGDWFGKFGGREERIFKVVVGDKEEVRWFEEELISVFDSNGVSRDTIWIMPKGKSLKELLQSFRYVKQVAEQYNVNVSNRLQILLGVR